MKANYLLDCIQVYERIYHQLQLPKTVQVTESAYIGIVLKCINSKYIPCI